MIRIMALGLAAMCAVLTMVGRANAGVRGGGRSWRAGGPAGAPGAPCERAGPAPEQLMRGLGAGRSARGR